MRWTRAKVGAGLPLLRMAAARTHRRVVLLVTVTALVASLFPLATLAVTQAQVNEACADSREQLDEYRAAQTEFEEAALEYESVLNEVEKVERKRDRVEGSMSVHSEDLDRIQTQIEEQAVELYMRGGLSSPGIILSASSVDQLMTTSEFLTQAATGGQRSIDELIAAGASSTDSVATSPRPVTSSRWWRRTNSMPGTARSRPWRPSRPPMPSCRIVARA